ncbi:MAG: Hsp70 family protein [Mogibacterium sp.]|nr:Hsp70 family protein [Mogibacterium sp.]
MAQYIGIDLGTTNSVICSYDGSDLRIWKSPEQNDVTPSAIYIDRRGNRYYGQKAYQQAQYNPGNAAVLFKRFLGTNTMMNFEAADLSMTPEECSAEIIQVLCGYLPEEIRKDPETAVVITVPAAFNQMKRDATMEAAELAGLERAALMQEPVAAIMSIMKEAPEEGFFLVYDLGGGTFDVSIAENIGGKVHLLSHGGIEMCGGRDIDRSIFDTVVQPWLLQNFDLPSDLLTSSRYRRLVRISQWAAERAKIELSSQASAIIAMSEDEMRCTDESGEEIYLDIELTRDMIDGLLTGIVDETVGACRETLRKSGLEASDISRIVFIGGPTMYKPLRDRVAETLGIRTDTAVDPMTAVAEGAAIFAESIDWGNPGHGRKAPDELKQTDLGLSFKYIARTPRDSAGVMLMLSEDLSSDRKDWTVEFHSLDTGWTSGRIRLEDKRITQFPLSGQGENRFRATLYDENGQPVAGELEEIVITRTLASIDAIPSSSSIAMEVIERLGGKSTLEFLVREGDPLPRKGSILVRAGQTVRAGSKEALNIRLWEGEIEPEISDNRFIGVLRISGKDIDAGVIPTGAEIECEYEVSDAGHIHLEASVPCIGATFTGQNLYSRRTGQETLDQDRIAESARRLLNEIEEMRSLVANTELYKAKEKAQSASAADLLPEDEAELIQKAQADLLEARKIVSRIRKENRKRLKEIRLRRAELKYFSTQKYMDIGEQTRYQSLRNAAKKALEEDDPYYDDLVDDIFSLCGIVLSRQSWFIIKRYNEEAGLVALAIDKDRFQELKEKGDQYLAKKDMVALRGIVYQMILNRIEPETDDAIFDDANIIKG